MNSNQDQQLAQLDETMSQFGLRAINNHLGKDASSEEVGELLPERLSRATIEQREELADLALDVCGLSAITRAAFQNDGAIDAEEAKSLIAMLQVLESDTLELIAGLVA